MTEKSFKKPIIAGLAFILVCFLARSFQQNLPADNTSQWTSILPPLIAITFAFTTGRVLLSLGLATLAGGLLVALPGQFSSPIAWFTGVQNAGGYVTSTVYNSKDGLNFYNLQIILFAPIMFAMIAIITASGGFQGIINRIAHKIKGRKSAQLATAVSGTLFFIDDYSNTMIVGSSMRMLTDKYRVCREKLAFIVDSTSAPIAGLSLISSWVAYEVTLFQKTGVGPEGVENYSGYSMFMDALGCQFYCILLLIFVFLHILFGVDYGPMKSYQDKALKEGVTPNTNVEEEKYDWPVKARCAIIPLLGLLAFHLTGIWLDGGGYEKIKAGESILHWIYWREVISGSENIVPILVMSACVGLFLATFCALNFTKLDLNKIFLCMWSGIKKSLIPSAILILAWSINNVCQTVDTGAFMKSLVLGNVSPMIFPALVFLIASITSFSTGTSWGTMAIIIPVAVPLAYTLDGDAYGIVTIVTLAATLDGSIFGDHCSPLSDTTILSSIASSCEHMNHVKTQIPYSISIAFLGVCCGYIPAAFGVNRFLCLLIGTGIMCGMFILMRKKHQLDQAAVG